MASDGGDQIARAAIELLTQRLREHVPHRERGEFKKALADRIERAPSYFDQLRRPGPRGGHITLADWIELSRALGLDPIDSLADIVRQPGEDANLPERPSGDPPAVVLFALRRCQTADETIQRGQPKQEEIKALEELDRLRYDHPERAILQAENAVETISAPLLPQLLGVLGSCYRMMVSHLNEAEHAIRTGLDLAKKDRAARGDLLRRLSYIAGERGDFRSALHVSHLALASHADGGQIELLGRCLVDTGIFRFHLEDYEGAIQAQKSALGWLSTEDTVHRCAAFQGLGLYYHRLKRVDLAHHNANRAEGFVRSLGRSAEIRLLWLRASIASDLKQYSDAEDMYRVVHDFLQENGSPVEQAMVTLDLALLLFRGGKKAEARAIIRSLLPQCLRSPNQRVGLVISRLVRHGESSITVERVAAARDALRRGQIRPRPG